MNGLTLFQILGFIGAFIVVISSIGTWYYGESEDNKKQLIMKNLGKQNSLMMHAMENSGQASWTRDKNGEIDGVIVELSGIAASKSSASATLSVEPTQKPIVPTP